MPAIPDFDDLPKVEGMPQGCAWGIFDRDGNKDLLGTLNLLTPAVVAAAATEVKDGISISLNWPLNGSKIPIPGRPPPVHKVIPLTENKLAWDDTLEFNTQGSSQWDSLVHLQHLASGLAYNGVTVTEEGLTAPENNNNNNNNTLPTLDHWHSRGGLVGRGVLIDFKAYMDAQQTAAAAAATKPPPPPFHAFGGHRITVEEVEAVARHQGVEFREGDILIVRTGATELWESPPAAADGGAQQQQQMRVSGLHGSEETARWVWNKHFSAVAGDSPSFEAFPPLKPDGTEGSVSDLVLHQYFLSLFGLSIGELWDLKSLSAYCQKTGRYSFMLTSAPLNHPGLVGSPPNALAIF